VKDTPVCPVEAALERNGHLNSMLNPSQDLSMSAATINRLLRMSGSTTRARKASQVVPEGRRRIKMRTFADWNNPTWGSMEMDLVAHCGQPRQLS
jgi:hypothetical protein